MTPADFDRPFIDEPAQRFVEHNRAEPERPRESRSEAQPLPERTTQPTSQSNAESEDKPSGERKRGWWKRVLS